MTIRWLYVRNHSDCCWCNWSCNKQFEISVETHWCWERWRRHFEMSKECFIWHIKNSEKFHENINGHFDIVTSDLVKILVSLIYSQNLCWWLASKHTEYCFSLITYNLVSQQVSLARSFMSWKSSLDHTLVGQCYLWCCQEIF